MCIYYFELLVENAASPAFDEINGMTNGLKMDVLFWTCNLVNTVTIGARTFAGNSMEFTCKIHFGIAVFCPNWRTGRKI